MKRRESTPPEGRDQDPTTFAEILQVLLWHEPRAIAAVLMDSEGETVDYASALSAFYAKVAAANLRVVLDDIVAAWPKLAACLDVSGSALTHAVVCARQRTFYVRSLPDGYALALVLRRRVFTVSTRAVTLAACRLAREAGWPAPPEETLPWHPAEIETSRADRFRPMQMRIGDVWEHIEVLGSVVASEAGFAREKGYRCRLQGGAEITLVRESTGVWFVDQPARGLSSQLGPESIPPPSPTSTASPSKTASASRSARPADSGAATRASPEASPERHVGKSDESGDMWAKEAKRAR